MIIEKFNQKKTVAYNAGFQQFTLPRVKMTYKVVEGFCDTAQGMIVALAAGIPRSIIVRAIKVSQIFQKKQMVSKKIKKFSKSSV